MTGEAGYGPGEEPDKAPRLRTGEFVLDYWGEPWRVWQTRQTDHGFTIYLGRPRAFTGPGGSELIITTPLAEHFERHRRNPLQMALPLGGTVIKRVRSILGHHRYQDAELWWLERAVDLQELTTADFCARHRVSAGAVSEARQELLGQRRARTAGWWRTPEMQALLMSKMPRAWIAQQMGVSVGSVGRLRWMAQQ